MLRLALTLLMLAFCLAPLWAAPQVVQTLVEVGKGGLPSQIRAPSLKASLLTGPMALSLEEGGKPLPQPAAGLTLSLRHGRDLYPFLDLTLSNTSAKSRSVSVILTFLLRPQADQLFFPATDLAHEPLVPGEKPRDYGYAFGGIATALPLGQLYSAKQDWGLAFFQELGLLIEPWVVNVAPDKRGTAVTIALPIDVAPGETQRRRVYFAATQGDWRPALGAVLAQFPRAFVPTHPEAVGLDGPFVCSGGTPPDDQIADWQRQGCKVVEIHCTMPFYGDYVPARDVWTPLIDDTWHTLKTHLKPEERPADSDWRGIIAAVEKQNPPAMTVAKVNDYVDRLHAHGMKGLIYYNPTEAWAPWAAEKFHDDMRYDAHGQFLPTWYESSQMIPDVDRPWGKHVLDQIRGELAAYPKLDGVFFDQSAGGGHDLTILCHEASKFVRARGGLCWWNGPYNMELAALADGMMTEGGGSDTYRSLTDIIQYYGLAGKSCVSLGSATPAGYAEMLSRGVQPQPITGLQEELSQRWSPLFQWMRGRQWVLEAHALDPVPGFETNVYRVAGGNVAVTLVPEKVWAWQPQAAYDLPVTVRLPEAKAIKAAYLLSPDWRGYHKLPLQRKADTLQVTVPRVRWAGMIVLAKSGVFPALEGPLHVVQGQAAQVRFVVDNWQAEPVAVDAHLTSGSTKASLRGQAAPGASLSMALELPAPAAGETTVALDVAGTVVGAALPALAELPVDASVIIALSAPARVQDDEALALQVRVLSHLPALRSANSGERLALTLQSPLAEMDAGQQRALAAFAPRPERMTALDLKLKPVRAGEGTVTVTARRGQSIVATAEQPLQVVATALSPEGLKHVLVAVLELESFGVDGGNYAHKPVTINGVAIGDLPSRAGDSWMPTAMPLPDEAVQALREHNEIAIDNTVADAFKVRNLRLLLTMRGGLLVVSATDRGVYTGWADWLYGEGKQFAAGQPLTGMRADLRIDPSRREKYDWFFGTPQSGTLRLQVAGSDAGQYAHKPVSVNGFVLGDLPAAPQEWTEVALPLTAEALAHLQTNNLVQIENSAPADAFKVRRARLEIVNTERQAFAAKVDEGVYTSCGWEFAEGVIGSPITLRLVFRGE